MEMWQRIITAPFLYPGFMCQTSNPGGRGCTKHNRGLFPFQHGCAADTGCAIPRPLSRLFCWDQYLILGFRNRKSKNPTVSKVKLSTCAGQAGFVVCTVLPWRLCLRSEMWVQWQFAERSSSLIGKALRVWAQQNLTFLLGQHLILRLGHFCPGLTFMKNPLPVGKTTYTLWHNENGEDEFWLLTLYLVLCNRITRVETKYEFTLSPTILFLNRKNIYFL